MLPERGRGSIAEVGGARAGVHRRGQSPWAAAMPMAITRVGPGSGRGAQKFSTYFGNGVFSECKTGRGGNRRQRIKVMPEKVTCIVKGEAHLHSDCRSITKIRTDSFHEYTRKQAHDKVKAAPGSIVVEGGGETAPLIPAERNGKEYVRTRPDDTTADNLLKVKEC